MSKTADRQAFQDVLLRFAAAVDNRDFAMHSGCFADDAEIVDFSGGTVTVTH